MSSCRSRLPGTPAAVEGTFRMADLLLRSRRADRDSAGLDLFTEIADGHGASPWAPQALVRKAAIEERTRLRVVDAELQTSVPAALVSYRRLVDRYPDDEAVEPSLTKLAGMYEDLRRYDLAARTLDELSIRFPETSNDAAWRAGEMYERRLQDPERARSAYQRVPPSSRRYGDAQRRAQR
jgi:tetratricopeptide (TPR) repeat protein